MSAPPGMALPLKIKSSVTQFPPNESIIPAFGALGWEDQAYLSVRVNDLPPVNASALLQGAHPLSLELLNLQAAETISCFSLSLDVKSRMVLSQLLQFWVGWGGAGPCGIWDLSSPTRDGTPASLYWQHGVSTTGLPGNPLTPSILKLILHLHLESEIKVQYSLSVCCVTLDKWLDLSEPTLLQLQSRAGRQYRPLWGESG